MAGTRGDGVGPILIGRYGDKDVFNGGTTAQGAQGVFEHRGTGKLHILLGCCRTKARTAASGRNDRNTAETVRRLRRQLTTLIEGNFDAWSSLFCATKIATLRAISR